MQQLVYDKPFGAKPAPDAALITLTVVMVGVTYLSVGMKLTTALTGAGITYPFSPFHRQPRLISWDEVKACYLRTYALIREYSGWGPRTYPGNRAHTTLGVPGLQLKLTNGDYIVLGPRRPQQLQRALEEPSEALTCIQFPEWLRKQS